MNDDSLASLWCFDKQVVEVAVHPTASTDQSTLQIV